MLWSGDIGCFWLYGNGVMRNPTLGLRRIYLRSTRVNKPLVERIIRLFILVGVGSAQLDSGYYQASHHNQRRLHLVLRLLVQGSVVVVVMAVGGWGMWNLGSDSLASQSDSLTAHPDPIYVAGCPVPDPLANSSTRGGIGKGRRCANEGFSHSITSRRSGGGLVEHRHGAERQREDKVSSPTSENSTSTSFGE
jgi:hypothetical protein